MSGRLRRARRSNRAGTTVVARLAMVAGLIVVALAVVAPAASANYARIQAGAGCDGAVTWQASASDEGTAEERTNVRVLVEYRVLDESGTAAGGWAAAGPVGAFDPEGDFRFSGTFTLPSGATGAELRVTPQVAWGSSQDGDPAGDPRFARVEIPSTCEDLPLAVAQQVDCDSGVVQVSVRNLGESVTAAELTVDGATVRALELAAGGDALITLPVLDARATQIVVRSGELIASDQVHGSDCEARGPAAVVLERCGMATPLAVVQARGGDAESVVQLRVAGAIVHRSNVAPGATLQRTLELPDGGSDVEVTIDGEQAAVGTVGGCDGPIAGLLSCGTAGRTACTATSGAPPTVEAPPPPPPSLTIELEDLPRTGPWERALALALGGTLIGGGGLALAARDRARPRPSQLAAVLAPYRQRWWDRD
jgi:hypothetical protein